MKYEIKKGKTYEEENGSTDERIDCDRGLNVATLSWCVWNRNKGDIIIEVEFEAKDILAIPLVTDGKFRVKKFSIVRKVPEAEIRKMITPCLE